jgi:hypothetical protein
MASSQVQTPYASANTDSVRGIGILPMVSGLHGQDARATFCDPSGKNVKRLSEIALKGTLTLGMAQGNMRHTRLQFGAILQPGNRDGTSQSTLRSKV